MVKLSLIYTKRYHYSYISKETAFPFTNQSVGFDHPPTKYPKHCLCADGCSWHWKWHKWAIVDKTRFLSLRNASRWLLTKQKKLQNEARNKLLIIEEVLQPGSNGCYRKGNGVLAWDWSHSSGTIPRNWRKYFYTIQKSSVQESSLIKWSQMHPVKCTRWKCISCYFLEYIKEREN